ncbi:hypothetical protein ACFL96_06745 [Thermoproteota archaeon]
MMNKRAVQTLFMICLALLLILSQFVSAQVYDSYVVVYIDTVNPFTLESIDVVKDDFYHEYLLLEDMLGDTEYTIRFEDDEGDALAYDALKDHKTIMDYIDLRRTASIKIMKDEQVYFEQPLSFCNNNGICEPCRYLNCTVAENSLSCDDCSTGTNDNYCDLVQDDICDPDCEGEDSDCAGCEPFCFYDGMTRPSFCSDFGGVTCAEDETCEGDLLFVETVDADGGEKCCVGDAECVSIQQYDDVPAEVFSADYGADVPSEDEQWELEAKEREELGMGFDESTLTEEEQKELHEDMGMKIYDPDIMTEEDWEEMWDDESFPGEYEEPLTFTEKVEEQVTAAVDSIPEEASLLLVIFMAIIIIFTLGLLVLFFTHRAHKSISKEETVPRIKKEINGLLKRGYDYNQIRSMLLNKGYDLISVNQELMDNYRRTSIQYGKK